MDKNKVISGLEKLRANSKKRNFKQTVDLIFNIKDIDLKKTDNHIDFFLTVPHSRGKKVKVCALVDIDLKEQAEKSMDKTVLVSDFVGYQNNKAMLKKLAKSYDFFVAQANIMAKVATTFGKVLGSRGKMPNPKAGCVVPPNADLGKLHERLQTLVRVKLKASPIIHMFIGRENITDEEIAANVMTVYDSLIHQLPSETNNIRSIHLKLTMSKPIRLDKDEVEEKKEEVKSVEDPVVETKPEAEVPKEEAKPVEVSETSNVSDDAQKSPISDKPKQEEKEEVKEPENNDKN